MWVFATTCIPISFVSRWGGLLLFFHAKKLPKVLMKILRANYHLFYEEKNAPETVQGLTL